MKKIFKYRDNHNFYLLKEIQWTNKAMKLNQLNPCLKDSTNFQNFDPINYMKEKSWNKRFIYNRIQDYDSTKDKNVIANLYNIDEMNCYHNSMKKNDVILKNFYINKKNGTNEYNKTNIKVILNPMGKNSIKTKLNHSSSTNKFLTKSRITFESLQAQNNNEIIINNENVDYPEKLSKIWKDLCILQPYQELFNIVLSQLSEQRKEDIIEREYKELYDIRNDLYLLSASIYYRSSILEDLNDLNEKLGFSLKNRQATSNEVIIQKISKKIEILRKHTVDVCFLMKKIKSKINGCNTWGKFDFDALSERYKFDKNYLIKMKEEMGTLKDGYIKYFFEIGKDSNPFLLDENDKKNKIKDPFFHQTPISDEMRENISQSIYIIYQELIGYQNNIVSEMSFKNISPLKKYKYSDIERKIYKKHIEKFNKNLKNTWNNNIWRSGVFSPYRTNYAGIQRYSNILSGNISENYRNSAITTDIKKDFITDKNSLNNENGINNKKNVLKNSIDKNINNTNKDNNLNKEESIKINKEIEISKLNNKENKKEKTNKNKEIKDNKDNIDHIENKENKKEQTNENKENKNNKDNKEDKDNKENKDNEENRENNFINNIIDEKIDNNIEKEINNNNKEKIDDKPNNVESIKESNKNNQSKIEDDISEELKKENQNPNQIEKLKNSLLKENKINQLNIKIIPLKSKNLKILIFRDDVSVFSKDFYPFYFASIPKEITNMFRIEKNILNNMTQGISPYLLLIRENNSLTQENDENNWMNFKNYILGMCAFSYEYENNYVLLNIKHISFTSPINNEVQEKDKEIIDEAYSNILMDDIKFVFGKIIDFIKNNFYFDEMTIEYNKEKINEKILNIFLNDLNFVINNETENEDIELELESEIKQNKENKEKKEEIKNNLYDKMMYTNDSTKNRIDDFIRESIIRYIGRNIIDIFDTAIITNNTEFKNAEKSKKDESYLINNVLVKYLLEKKEKANMNKIYNKITDLDQLIKLFQNNSINTKEIPLSLAENRFDIICLSINKTSFNNYFSNSFFFNNYNNNNSNSFLDKNTNIYYNYIKVDKLIYLENDKYSIKIYHLLNDNTGLFFCKISEEFKKNLNSNNNIYTQFNTIYKETIANNKIKILEDKFIWIPCFEIYKHLKTVSNNSSGTFHEYIKISNKVINYLNREPLLVNAKDNDKQSRIEPDINKDILFDDDFMLGIINNAEIFNEKLFGEKDKNSKKKNEPSAIFLSYIKKKNFIINKTNFV